MTMEMVSRQNAEWQSADLHNTLVTQLCKLFEHKHKKCNTLMLHNRWTDTNVANLTQVCRVWIGDTTHVHNTQKKCSIHIWDTTVQLHFQIKMHACKAQVCNLFTYIYIHMRHTLQKHWAQFDKCWITSINCRHLFSFTSIHIHGFPAAAIYWNISAAEEVSSTMSWAHAWNGKKCRVGGWREYEGGS